METKELSNLQKQEIMNILNEKEWDIKEWARAIQIAPKYLQWILDGYSPLNQQEYDELLRATKDSKTKNMMRFSHPVVIVSWARKGGNGKTTVASNLSYNLSKLGYQTLAIDGDSQCDMTSTLFPEYMDHSDHNFYESMVRRKDIRKYIVDTDYPNLSIVPGSSFTEELERMLTTIRPEIAMDTFKDCIDELLEENYYDFIIVDMDKSMGLLNKTILNAADYVLVLAECSFYSVKALLPVTERIEQVKQFNPKLDCLGMVFNKVNKRKNEVQRAIDDTDRIFPWDVMVNFISNDGNVEKSQRECLPLDEYAKNSKANKQLIALTNEILSKIETNIKEGRLDGEVKDI